MARWNVYNQYGEYKGTVEDSPSSGSSSGISVIKVIVFIGLLYIGGKAGIAKWLWNSAPTARPSLAAKEGIFMDGYSWIGELWKAGGFSGKLEVIFFAVSIIVPIAIAIVFGIRINNKHLSSIRGIIIGIVFGFLSMVVLSAVFALFNIGPEGYLNSIEQILGSLIWNILVLGMLPATLIVCIQAVSSAF